MVFDRAKLESYPIAPGVYLMRNRSGAVLYVGKAKNLKTRLKQYFFPGRDERAMVPFLVEKVETIDTLVVSSEKEALLLEYNLIKKHKPRYNALLKDDKSYVSLKLTTRSTWPQLQLVRYRDKPKPDGHYFGPYTSAHAARGTLDLIQRVFPLRQCTDVEFASRTRPCILYDMKRCLAPCVGKCTKEAYDVEVKRVVQFLKGQDKDLLNSLFDKMQRQSDALDFEGAARTLSVIRQIEATVEAQGVDNPSSKDADAFGIFRQADEVVLFVLEIRQGKLMGSKKYDFSQVAEDDEELLSSFLLQRYSALPTIPHELLIPCALELQEALAEILSQERFRQVSIVAPKKGDKLKLVEMARQNAEAVFRKDKDEKTIRERILLEMQDKFHLRRYPERIESFDSSNSSGGSLVSTLVAFTEGVKDSARYRKYKIRSAGEGDDYGALREVLQRRCVRAKAENDLPDLIVIDGGKGHLNAALAVLKELDIVTVDVIGLAKEESRHDRGLTAEQVFLPGAKDPILLPKHSPLLFMLQQIRDEAHRTAIAYHRNVRKKKSLHSILDTIPGIGPVKRKLLLKTFGSVKGIVEAGKERLLQVKGLSKQNVEDILKELE